MTGEITLARARARRRGVKEKAVAALRGGMARVVLPAANATTSSSLPAEGAESVRFELVRTMDEVMDAVLVRPPAERRVADPSRRA
jgi:ATP-dependent Lon protease